VNVDEIYESDENFSKQFQILRPQTARTFELGGELQRSRGALRLTLFHMDVDDEIHLDPFTSGVGNTNLPPSRRQGVELEGRLQASAAVRISAGYAFTSARFREGVLPGGPFVIGTEISIAGRHVPLVPEHKIDARVVWDVMDGARLSAGVTSVSKQYMDNDEPNTLGTFVPAYAVVDLTFAHDFAWGRITATGNNLLGERYFTYGVRSQFTADRYAVYPLPGRGFSLAAELKLD
jgi:iron complex outermembrane receptor protein